MRVAFAGTPPFAARALEAIASAGHEVCAVLTQPDRPAGRGLRLASSAVAETAARLGIETLKPISLKQGDAPARLSVMAPDVMVVAAYGLLLPGTVLAIPKRGCLNIHASLLPRWRGAAPIQRALLAGDTRCGICIMQMEAGLDTGPVLLERPRDIGPRETAGELTDALAALGAEAIVDALAHLDELVGRKQDSTCATYASKISRADARIDWTEPSAVVDRQIRAFNPVPGAEGLVAGEILKVWKAEPSSASGSAGEIVARDAQSLVIACGQGAMSLREVQRPGGKRLPIREYLRGAHPSKI